MSPLSHSILHILPPAWRHRAVEAKNSLWGGFRHHYYSQFGEDVVLGNLLKSKTGFFVDVGANHPERYSNTQLLYERGWRGINIEPNAQAARTFAKTRTRDITLVCGVGTVEEVKTYYRFSDPAYNTFSPGAAEALKEKKWLAALESMPVPVRRLASVLAEHVLEGTDIDLLTIDAEGSDMDVLESNDWSNFSPRVVCVEAHTFDVENPHKTPAYAYLIERNYRLAAWVGPTLIFMMKEKQGA